MNNEITTFDINKLGPSIRIHRNFITEQSNEIPDKLILYATLKVNRAPYVIELSDTIRDINIALNIDAGVFEFTLLHTITYNICKSLIPNIYIDKMLDIITNIKRSPTLLKNLHDGIVDPKMVAFLAPHQLCPENWKILLSKMQKKAEHENNLPTTDLYTCKKCGQKRCIVREAQIRSADEPMTKFITCCNCYTTFIK